MKKIVQQLLIGERALFHEKDLEIYHSTFADGESPLKESANIKLYNSFFKWKYPLWYSEKISLKYCTLFDMARAGIWYTNHILLEDFIIDAPKSFRRTKDITLNKVTMTNASETLWNCSDIIMNQVNVKSDYFAMNSKNIQIDGLQLVGNYSFDGCENIIMRNAKLLSKDAFWNCENVTVYDSTISGEYIGWNSQNVTFINCMIESDQGFCYMDNVVLQNCRLVNTVLAFEYSSVKVDVVGKIDSVKNPRSGTIQADKIDEIYMENHRIDKNKTEIKVGELKNVI